jgi:mannosyltransferase OCH1-like enzyme
MSINKIIHQIWLGPKPQPIKAMQTWQENHPTWQYILWTEANLPKLTNQVLFDSFGQQYHGKADVVRYEMLYQYGGVYCDADTYCLKPLDNLLNNDCFAAYENESAVPGLVCNAFIGASKRNALMLALIEGLKGKICQPSDKPWILTGPKHLTNTIERLHYPITLLPSWTFYPNHFNLLHRVKPQGQPYAEHFWGTTRNAY